MAAGRWCIALAALMLAGCATTSTVSTDVAAPPGFELAGRIAARYQERAFSSALRWKQGSGRDEIWLSAPLGQTMAHLLADADGATVTTADHRKYQASSLESLTRSALGWRFPVAGLRYWVLGQPAPGMPVARIERDDVNRVVRLQQADFNLIFTYPDASLQRPSRIDISSGDAEIRLVVDSLTVEP